LLLPRTQQQEQQDGGKQCAGDSKSEQVVKPKAGKSEADMVESLLWFYLGIERGLILLENHIANISVNRCLCHVHFDQIKFQKSYR
jgi:hypothetical protein